MSQADEIRCEISELSVHIDELEDHLLFLTDILHPFYEERQRIHDLIYSTHAIDNLKNTIAYGVNGRPARKPLFSAMDSLHDEYKVQRNEYREVKFSIKTCERRIKVLRDALKLQKKKDAKKKQLEQI